MAHGSHLYLWPTDANRAALRKLTNETHPSGWLELEGSSADAASREFETAAVLFDLSTTTDSFLIELFLGGNSVRALEYSSDDGWSLRGRAAPFENAARLKPWLAKRHLLASPDGYDVLEAFLGSAPESQPKLLAAIARASELKVTGGWNFGGLEQRLGRDRDVGVRGLSESLTLASAGVELSLRASAPDQVIELARDPSSGPVAWKDLGVFFSLTLPATPFAPTAAQERFLTDDALEDLRRAHEQSTATQRSFFWPTRGLNAVVTRKRCPPRAVEATWKPWIELRTELEGAPRGGWTKAGASFERPFGERVVRCDGQLAVRSWGAIDGLGRALDGRALGGDALEALGIAWSRLGVPPILFLGSLAAL